MQVGSEVIVDDREIYHWAMPHRANQKGRVVSIDREDNSYIVEFNADMRCRARFLEDELTEIGSSNFESIGLAIDYIVSQGYEVTISKK